MTLKKITEAEMKAAGVCAAPDVLTGTPAENKAVFDRMVRQLVAPAYNAAVDAVNELGSVESGVKTAEQERVDAETRRIKAEEARNVFEEYDAGKRYVPGNKVARYGSSYICIKPCAGVAPPDVEHWLLIAQKGADGIATMSEGLFYFNVNEDGILRLYYTGETPPDINIDEAGHLILTLSPNVSRDVGRVVGPAGSPGITPHIGANGNWYLGETDTGVKATGPAGTPGKDGAPGRDGDPGEKGDTGAQGAKGDTGATGPQGETGPAGPQGPAGAQGVPGKTPVKGVDYFTATDKQEIVDAVLAALPDGTEVDY